MADTHNTINGPSTGPVLQAGHIDTVHLSPQVPLALAGLPALDATFTGRSEDLTQLSEALASPRPVVVSALTGLAGIGKTTLAIKAAHDAVAGGRFPGGVLFVDIQGYSTESRIEPHAALSIFLRALGVAPEHVPHEQAAREALYRTKLAELEGSVLVLLDNVSSTAQVRPLLPPTAVHRVLVTSRHSLGDLRGARKIGLDVLSHADSVAVLDTVLRAADPTDDRVSVAPDATGEVAELCGHLPLALSIVGALLADDRNRPIDNVVNSLRDAATRLGELAYDDDLTVRAAFDLSYSQLTVAEARLFVLLSLNPGPQVSVDAAAALADLPRQDTARLLERLRRAHMIEHGEPHGRFRFHDLLRLYAQELAREEPEHDAAITRLLDHYVHATERAENDLLATARADLRWPTIERSNLVGAVALAHQRDQHSTVLSLAFAMMTFLANRRHSHENIAVFTQAVSAADRLGDQRRMVRALRVLRRLYREAGDQCGEGEILGELGKVSWRNGDLDQAAAYYRRSVALFEEAGDLRRAAQMLEFLNDLD